MNDEIAKKFDREWTPHVVREDDVEVVRSWLREQDEDDIQLYLSTFRVALEEDHPARTRLLEEELERRAEPPPDRVKQTITYLRSKWLVAISIVLVTVFTAIASARESVCDVWPSFPFGCVQGEPTIKDIFGEP